MPTPPTSSITYTVVYGGYTNTLTVTYSNTVTAVGGEPGVTGNAYTAITGTWGGNAITGMYGSGGSYQTETGPSGTYFDNTYFASNAQGDGGSSFKGIDYDGLAFTANSVDIVLYWSGGSTFSVMYGSTSGSITSLSVACFRAGTNIRTARGDVAIETVRIGDAAALAGGGFGRVIWTGRRSVVLTNHPRPWDVMPVHVQAHAFAENQPERDLVVSPDHAVFTGGVLIPVRYLINGASIRQQAVERVTWWHVELERHGVILAEGLPTESYLDTGNRSAFEGEACIQMQPDFARTVWEGQGCAALVTDGPVVRAAREALLERLTLLNHAVSADPDLHITAGGRTLPAQTRDNRWCVVVPDDAAAVHLGSRILVPADMFPQCDDRRRLGVAVTALWIDGEAVPLDDPRLTGGWQPAESGLRWTDGYASIAAPGGSVVEVELALLGQYYVPAERASRRAA